MAGKSLIGALRVTLGLDSAQFSTGMGKARREVKTTATAMQNSSTLIKGALGGMFAAVSLDTFTRLAKQGLDYASSLGETAKQLGVSTKALQEYRYAATQTGLAQEEMDAALASGTRRLGQMSDATAAAYRALKVETRDANGALRDIGDLMPEIAEGLKGVASPAERAAVLVDLFGRSGQKLAPLLDGGAASVNGLRDSAQRLGIVMDDAMIQKADDAADKMAELKTVLDAKFAIAVSENGRAIAGLVKDLIDFVEWVGKAAYAWRAFKDMDWSGNQSKAFMSREFGPAVELTFTPQELAAKRRAAAREPMNPAFLRTPSGGAAPAPRRGLNPWLTLSPALRQRGSNAVGANAFATRAAREFTPGAGVAGWMTTPRADADAEIATGEKLVAMMNARSDAAMKAARVAYPALSVATGKLTEKEIGLRDAVQGVMDRLFPEVAETRTFNTELAALEAAHRAGALSATDHAAAVAALKREYLGLARGGIGDGVMVLEGESGDMDAAIDRARDVSDRIADSFAKVGATAKVQRVEVVKSFAEMVDGTLRETDRLVKGIKSGNVLDIVGGVLNLFDGIGRMVGGFNIGPLKFGQSSAGTPGFASGGAMRLGGLGGVDRNLLSLNGAPLARVTAGETMTITPANDRGGAGGTTIVQNYYGPGADEFWGKIAAGNQQAAVAGARGGADLAMGRMASIRSRTLA